MTGAAPLCACGSGLRPARCCQVDPAWLSPPGSALPLAAVIGQAAEALRQNAVEEARRLCLDILELAPGQLDALTMLYQICTAQGPAAAAGDANLRTLLGWARMEEADRNLNRALELLDRAERLAPEDLNILLSRAVVHGRNRDYAAALATLDRIAALSGETGLGGNELL